MVKLKNPYKKGRKAELEYGKTLEDAGYSVIYAPKGNKFSKQQDFFGYWDLIAHNEHEWLVVQVKSSNTGGVLKKYKEISKLIPINTRCELVIRLDQRKFKSKWRIIDLK